MKRMRADTAGTAEVSPDAVAFSDLRQRVVPHHLAQIPPNGLSRYPSHSNFVSLEEAFSALSDDQKQHVVVTAAKAIPELEAFVRTEYAKARSIVIGFESDIAALKINVPNGMYVDNDFPEGVEAEVREAIPRAFNDVKSKVHLHSSFETKANALRALAEMAIFLNEHGDEETAEFLESVRFDDEFLDAVQWIADQMTDEDMWNLRSVHGGEVWTELKNLREIHGLYDGFASVFKSLKKRGRAHRSLLAERKEGNSENTGGSSDEELSDSDTDSS